MSPARWEFALYNMNSERIETIICWRAVTKCKVVDVWICALEVRWERRITWIGQSNTQSGKREKRTCQCWNARVSQTAGHKKESAIYLYFIYRILRACMTAWGVQDLHAGVHGHEVRDAQFMHAEIRTVLRKGCHCGME